MAPRERRARVEQRVEAVRRFNRFYTKQIGVLQEHLLRSPYSLTEARVLYELAHHEQATATATDLGAALGLDAGYLSRILSSFQKQGLLERKTSETDGRRSLLRLTPRGRNAFGKIDAASHNDVGAMLRNLPPDAQSRWSPRCTRSKRCLAPRPTSGPPTSSGRTARATWAGSSSGTASCTLKNTAGTSSSRRWSPKSSRSSCGSTTPSGSAAGSPSRMGRTSAPCSSSRSPRGLPSSVCCWSSRRPGGWASARGW